MLANIIGRSKKVIILPEDQDYYCTPSNIIVPVEWWAEAREIARTLGLTTLGDIHTHNDTSKYEHDTAPSETDWDMNTGPLHGICAIRKYPSGRMIARIRFWPADALVKTKVTE